LSELIPINNIYIITGLSDTDWEKDTKNRMPESINSRVYHRQRISKEFFEGIKGKKNVLIIMDEIQIACKKDQTIHKTFRECGFYDLDFLLENDIKLIQFSATPDGNMNDILDWKHHSAKVKLEPGIGYYGPKQAIEQDRVKQFQDLTIIDNVKALKECIESNFTNPRYHLIRVPNKRKNKDGSDNQSKVITNFKCVFGENYEYNNCLIDDKDDINDILIKQPDKHTFIYICEKYRCAKTIEKQHIGVSYERYVSSSGDSTIIQGLFGRDTGYNNNGDSICYTNIPSLENYIQLWENGMEFKEGTIWNTSTTQYNKKDDITSSTGTFNSVKHIEKLKDNCSEKVKDIYRYKIGEKGELIKWFTGNYPDRGKPHGTKKNKDGIYYWRKQKITKEILDKDISNNNLTRYISNQGLVHMKGRYLLAYYDNDTVKWCLIYYENDV